MKRLVFVIAALFVATTAHAQSKDPCITAYEQSQTLKKDGKFISAREQAQICAKDSCPAILVKDCTRWIGELDASLGSILCEAKTTNGSDVFDARVTLDGTLIASRLDGKPISVDPGKHVLHFERGAATYDENVLVREGEKNRRITATFPDDVKTSSSSLPTGFWIFGGATIVALGVATVFTIDGLGKKDDLESCKPRCAPNDVDAMSASFTIADVALGAGVAFAATTLYLLLARPSADPRSGAGGTPGVLRF